MAWQNDKGLQVLINQVKALHPGMTVYTIGDASHSSRVSDHNPLPNGDVCAADFMLGKHFSKADGDWLFDRLARGGDSRFKYAIFYDQIVSGVVQPGVIRDYDGTNPHTDHVHVSVKNSKNTSPWDLGRKIVFENIDNKSLPVLHYHDQDPIDKSGWYHVTRAQKQLGVEPDGDYGQLTANAVKALGFGDGKVINKAVWDKLFGFRPGV